MNGIRTGRASFITKPATKRRTIASAPLMNLSSSTPAPSPPRPLLHRSISGQGLHGGAEERCPGRLEPVRHAHGAAEDPPDPADVQMLAVAIPDVEPGGELLDGLAVRGQGREEPGQHVLGGLVGPAVDEEPFDLAAAGLVRRD